MGLYCRDFCHLYFLSFVSVLWIFHHENGYTAYSFYSIKVGDMESLCFLAPSTSCQAENCMGEFMLFNIVSWPIFSAVKHDSYEIYHFLFFISMFSPTFGFLFFVAAFGKTTCGSLFYFMDVLNLVWKSNFPHQNQI